MKSVTQWHDKFERKKGKGMEVFTQFACNFLMIYKDDRFERKKGKGREVFTQFACNFLMIYKDNRLFFLLLSMCKHHCDMAADVKSILRERSLR